ncbi:uncharacterized protein [Amphiura filiformis]|uniref:uncharacterized protein n=1 Tax=Amphiura filiformis TaxID=82378 RepID=UPI003B20C893
MRSKGDGYELFQLNNNCLSCSNDKLCKDHRFTIISRICYPPKWLCTCVTRRLATSLRRSIVLGMLYFLLVLSFMSTVGFWTILSDIRTENKLTPELTGDTDTKRQLRSLRDWMEFPDIDMDQFNAADMFIIKPAEAKETELRDIPDTNDKQPAVIAYINATSVCPELDIPDLVIERKVNLSDVSIDEVEKILLGERLKDVRRLVEKTNSLINQTRVGSNTSFVSCSKAMSRDECGNKAYREALESNRMLTDNYMYTPGGIWTPTDCLPRWKVAIVIPYRNRSFHLPIVIRFLTPMLQRQKLEFGFYIAEQANNLNFNRAMLMNVGFLEALNFSKWDCFIFHDVDHIPISDYNYYGCSGMPRHFVSGADRWKYKLPYQDFFGAVTGLGRGQIFQINGFPNVYWGWGGEDDEILSRVREAGLEVSRIKGPKGYHNVIRHHHHSAPQMKERFQLLRNFKPRLKKDGLNNLQYKKPEVTLHVLYTNISVDIQKLKVDVPPVKNVVKPKAKGQPKKPAPKPVIAKPKANLRPANPNLVGVIQKQVEPIANTNNTKDSKAADAQQGETQKDQKQLETHKQTVKPPVKPPTQHIVANKPPGVKIKALEDQLTQKKANR